MDWNTAFDLTLKEFGISAKKLSERSGISQQSISKFRKGHCPMTTDNLNTLLQELPVEAKQRFFSFLLGESLLSTHVPTIEEQLDKLSKHSKKELVKHLVESLVREPTPANLGSELAFNHVS